MLDVRQGGGKIGTGHRGIQASEIIAEGVLRQRLELRGVALCAGMIAAAQGIGKECARGVKTHGAKRARRGREFARGGGADGGIGAVRKAKCGERDAVGGIVRRELHRTLEVRLGNAQLAIRRRAGAHEIVVIGIVIPHIPRQAFERVECDIALFKAQGATREGKSIAGIAGHSLRDAHPQGQFGWIPLRRIDIGQQPRRIDIARVRIERAHGPEIRAHQLPACKFPATLRDGEAKPEDVVTFPATHEDQRGHDEQHDQPHAAARGRLTRGKGRGIGHGNLFDGGHLPVSTTPGPPRQHSAIAQLPEEVIRQEGRQTHKTPERFQRHLLEAAPVARPPEVMEKPQAVEPLA
jgi:hypothetical protein